LAGVIFAIAGNTPKASAVSMMIVFALPPIEPGTMLGMNSIG